MHHSFHSSLYANQTFRLFSSGSDAPLNGVHHLNPILTINNISVSPEFVYFLGDATATELSAAVTPDGNSYGENLTIVGTGDDPTLNDGSPLLGPDDDSVRFNGAKAYQYPNTGEEIGTNDFVFEFVVKSENKNQSNVVLAKGTTSGEFQVALLHNGTNGWWRVWLNDSPSGDNKIITIPNIDPETWYHVLVVGDNENDMLMYVNGIKEGTTDISGSNFTEGNNEWTIARRSNATSEYTSNISYVAYYKKQDWFSTATTTEIDAIAQDRFNKLIGIHPQRAKGSPTPTTQTRASTAYLDKLSGSVRQLYKVGDDWLRVVRRQDVSGSIINGYLAESSTDNLLLSSSDLASDGTSVWTFDNCSISASSVEAPDSSLTMFQMYPSDTVDNFHNVKQFVQPSAGNVTFSCFLSASDVNWAWLKLSNTTTLANVGAFFELTGSGQVGTTESQVSGTFIEDWGNGIYRCGINWVHDGNSDTCRVYSALADNDADYAASDVSTPEIYLWGPQVEETEHMTSYIPTEGSTVTRSDDQLTYKADGGNFNSDSGTIVVDFLTDDYDTKSDKFLFDMNDGDSSDHIAGFIDASQNDNAAMLVVSGSVTQATFNGSPNNVSDNIRHSGRWKWTADDFEALIDETSIGTDTNGTPPNFVDEIDIGLRWNDNNQFDGVISNIRIYDKPTRKG